MIKRQEQPAKTDEEINKSREEDTNLDRDGRERHPTEQHESEKKEDYLDRTSADPNGKNAPSKR
jgi:hypothetical protein